MRARIDSKVAVQWVERGYAHETAHGIAITQSGRSMLDEQVAPF